MIIKSMAVVGFAAFTFVSVYGQAPARADETKFIRIGTGNQTGTWPPLGIQMAKIINANVKGVKATSLLGAGVANIKNIQTGRIEIGFSTTTSEAKSIKGDKPFGTKHDKPMHLFSMYPIVAQFAVKKDGSIKSYSDLVKGSHRINANTRGSTTYNVLKSILGTYDITDESIVKAGGVVNYVAYADGVAQMQDGNIEMTGAIGPVPHNVILQLVENPGVRLLALDAARAKHLADTLPGYFATTIKAGSYKGIAEDVSSIGIGTNVLATSDLSEDVVFKVMTAIFDNISDIHGLFAAAKAITQADGPKNNIYPLHPGARKFYKSKGIKVN
mgnify:CR=1 FL=1|jgi:uncharacterized protein